MAPAQGMDRIAALYPQALQLKLDEFRQWIGVLPIDDAAKLDRSLNAVHAAPFAQLPAATQQMLVQFSDSLHVATLPVYTHLFDRLGYAAIACTLIALSVIPIMKKLSATHAHNSELLPDIRGEQ